MSRVFLSHRSTDIAIVKDVAAKLHAAGIEVWLDAWNIEPGDDFVAQINSALVSCDAAVIFFSHAVADGPWIQKEISYLIKAATEKRMPVIPVMIDVDAEVPPLFATADRVGIAEIERLIDRLLGKSPAPPVAAPVPSAPLWRFRILLRVRGEGDQRKLLLSAWRDAGLVVEDQQTVFPAAFVHAFETFLHLRVAGARDSASREHAVQRAVELRHLGDQIGQALFPDEVDAALAEFLRHATANAAPAEIVLEAEGELLSIPFEAARLRNGAAPAMHPLVRFSRRLARDGQPKLEPKSVPPGPFKVLVAVGHPDETKTENAVLDYEREVHTILDALGQAVELKGSQVRWLEVGSLEAIGEALREESYHVLHVSGHGSAGTIELEDHQGEPVTVTAAQLATEILKGARAGRPTPLVFLAACESGLGASETASFAQELLEHGVRQVVAMQTAVSDVYATQLAGLFYRELTRAHAPIASHALAIARQHLEAKREKRMARAESSSGLTPEYATPALFQSGEEQPLWDRALAQEPLRKRGEVRAPGAVPMLGPDDLIGRRPQVREVMAELTRGKSCGVQIVAMGGTGKSSLAGRVMRLLAEEGWTVAAVTGRYTIADLAKALREAGVDGIDERMQEQDALSAIGGSLRSERVLLVLDDFHEMLEGPSARFQSEIDGQIFRELLSACGKGKMILTSRYPVQVNKAQLRRVDLGPLSVAESRKLLLRLGALQKQSPGLTRLMTAIGGHPRMLEFLDGILNQGDGRLRHVTERLEARAAGLGIDLEQTGVSFEEALALTVKLGAQDILLDDLLAGLAEHSLRALRQIAVFPEAVPLAVVPGSPSREVARGLARSSLVHQPAGDQEMVWVHRWTAELILGKMAEAERREVLCAAGRVLADPNSPAWNSVAAMRLFVGAQAWAEAEEVAERIAGTLEANGAQAAALALADEVLPWIMEDRLLAAQLLLLRAKVKDSLGEGDPMPDFDKAIGLLKSGKCGPQDKRRDSVLASGLAVVAHIMRRDGHLAKAVRLFREALEIRARRKDSGDWRDLAAFGLSLNEVSALLAERGRPFDAASRNRKAVQVLEGLAKTNEDPLVMRYLASAYSTRGAIEDAGGGPGAGQESHRRALEIRVSLVEQSPDNDELWRDYWLSYSKFIDSSASSMDPRDLKICCGTQLGIAKRLTENSPDAPQRKHDLAGALIKMGDFCACNKDADNALARYHEAVMLMEELTVRWPDRLSFRKDLARAMRKFGGVVAVDRLNEGMEIGTKAHMIIESLATAYPFDLEILHDLRLSHESLARLLGESGDGSATHAWAGISIAVRLIELESSRSKFRSGMADALDLWPVETSRPQARRIAGQLRLADLPPSQLFCEIANIKQLIAVEAATSRGAWAP